MTTLVSIYISTKNRVRSLQAALDSVLTQSHRELDIIVVDDGSSDDTPEYLHRVSQREQRVRYVRHESSAGAARARNAAIELAEGDFITGLDDDDLFMPMRVKLLLQYWQLLVSSGEKPACLYTQDWCSSGGRRSASKKLGSVAFEDLFHQNHIGNQIFLPLDTLRAVGAFDVELPAWQDLELFMRLMKSGTTARLLDLPLYVFDMNPRADRVTKQAREKLEGAYRLVAQRHADTPRRRQQLYLQLFREGYDLQPTWKDWAHFVKLGVWPAGAVRLVRSHVR